MLCRPVDILPLALALSFLSCKQPPTSEKLCSPFSLALAALAATSLVSPVAGQSVAYSYTGPRCSVDDRTAASCPADLPNSSFKGAFLRRRYESRCFALPHVKVVHRLTYLEIGRCSLRSRQSIRSTSVAGHAPRMCSILPHLRERSTWLSESPSDKVIALTGHVFPRPPSFTDPSTNFLASVPALTMSSLSSPCELARDPAALTTTTTPRREPAASPGDS